jgi:hypothetical protein
MRYVIRKGSLFDNLFLTASHHWGRLEKAKTFTERQADQVAGTLATNNYGIFDLGHARHMVNNEPQVKATREAFQHASRLLESVTPELRARLLGPGQTPQAIIRALGPFQVKDASQIDAKGYDVISDRAFLNFRTLWEAEAVCEYMNNICKAASGLIPLQAAGKES